MPALQAAQQQQPQAVSTAALPAVDFDGQVAAVRQLSQLQSELADQKLSMARLRQQAEEDHARWVGGWVERAGAWVCMIWQLPWAQQHKNNKMRSEDVSC